MSDLANVHPTLFLELVALCRKAKEDGVGPGDVMAVVEALTCDAVWAVTHECDCQSCSLAIKHVHQN